MLPEAKDSAYNRILEWAQADPKQDNPTKLTTYEKELYMRWTVTHDLLLKYGIPRKVAFMVMKRYDVSRATAYNYIRDSQQFYGQMDKIDGGYGRVLLWNYCMKAMHIALAKKDAGTVAKLSKNMLELLPDQNDMEMLKNLIIAQINIVADPDKIGLPKMDEDELQRKLSEFLPTKTIKVHGK